MAILTYEQLITALFQLLNFFFAVFLAATLLREGVRFGRSLATTFRLAAYGFLLLAGLQIITIATVVLPPLFPTYDPSALIRNWSYVFALVETVFLLVLIYAFRLLKSSAVGQKLLVSETEDVRGRV